MDVDDETSSDSQDRTGDAIWKIEDATAEYLLQSWGKIFRVELQVSIVAFSS